MKPTMPGSGRHKTYAIYDGPDPIDVEVGLSLRRLRRKVGLSQTDLGEALGISFQQVQKYERGVNRVSASALVKMARCLGVSVSELLPHDDAPPLPSDVTRHMQVRGAEELLESYCLLPGSSQRRAVLQLLRVMLNVARAPEEEEAPPPPPPAAKGKAKAVRAAR